MSQKSLNEIFEGCNKPYGATPVNIEGAPEEVIRRIKTTVEPRPDITTAPQCWNAKSEGETKRTEKFEAVMTLHDNRVMSKFFRTPLLLNEKKDVEAAIEVFKKILEAGVFDDEEDVK
jgi:hypothetical protein